MIMMWAMIRVEDIYEGAFVMKWSWKPMEAKCLSISKPGIRSPKFMSKILSKPLLVLLVIRLHKYIFYEEGKKLEHRYKIDAANKYSIQIFWREGYVQYFLDFP